MLLAGAISRIRNGRRKLPMRSRGEIAKRILSAPMAAPVMTCVPVCAKGVRSLSEMSVFEHDARNRH
jgi:hypothetical protein